MQDGECVIGASIDLWNEIMIASSNITSFLKMPSSYDYWRLEDHFAYNGQVSFAMVPKELISKLTFASTSSAAFRPTIITLKGSVRTVVKLVSTCLVCLTL